MSACMFVEYRVLESILWPSDISLLPLRISADVWSKAVNWKYVVLAGTIKHLWRVFFFTENCRSHLLQF